MPLRSFKKCVVAYSDDLPPDKRDKLPNWIKNARGIVSKDITDEVTHFIISRKQWDQYDNKVREARRTGCIYLMKYRWFEDSLLLNKGRPLEEVDGKYTWELEHAKKVEDKKRRKRREKAKEIARARKVAAREEAKMVCEAAGEQCVGSESEAYAIENVHSMRSVRKVQQINQCGIRFDKTLLEKERDMALSGYRPYVDENGFVYLITLVREDVLQNIKEQETLKYDHFEVTLPVRQRTLQNETTSLSGSLTRPNSSCEIEVPDLVEAFERFAVNENTEAHYLEDDDCCRQWRRFSFLSDDIHDGNCSWAQSEHSSGYSSACSSGSCSDTTSGDTTTSFFHLEQELPFSIYPVAAYSPVPKPRITYSHDPPAEVRVDLPKPYAYSLQLYESFDRPAPEPAYRPTPTSTPVSHTSFKSFLPSDQSSPNPASQAEAQAKSIPTTPKPLIQEKNYQVILHYTSKGSKRASLTEVSAGPGSTFAFAHDMFRRIFAKRTGLSWEDALAGKTASSQPEHQRDSGVSLAAPVPPTITNTDLTNINDAACPSSLATADISGDLQKQPFEYIRNTAADLELTNKNFLARYGEDWLPDMTAKLARSTGVGVVVAGEKMQDQDTKVGDAAGLMNDRAKQSELEVESKPAFDVCSDDGEGGFACEGNCDDHEKPATV